MQKLTADSPAAKSADLVAANLATLRSLFPELLTETQAGPAVNLDVLKQLVGDRTVTDAEEKYGLNWHGKRRARQLALTPSTGTLRPCPEDSVEWATTKNLMIEGDNLEVLKLLQKSYAGKVKLIYIDPPYNTGKDFVYSDDFQDNIANYMRQTKQTDAGGLKTSSNTEASGRFHTDWLNMMYPRLKLARNLLREDGVIFVSLDDNEVHNLRSLMDEIFGSENFVAQIVWQRSKKGDAKLIASVHEYIVCYVRDQAAAIASGVWRQKKEGAAEVLAHYNELKAVHGGDHERIRAAMLDWYKTLGEDDPRKAHRHYCWSDDRGLYFAADFAGPDDGRDSRPRHDILHPVTGKPCKKPSTGWRWDEEKTAWALTQVPPRIHFGVDETTIPNRKSYLAEISTEPFSSVFYRDGRSATLEVESLVGKGWFQFPKNTDVLAELIELTSKPGDLVVDFFSGSGSTAHAIWKLELTTHGQRRFVMVQLPEATGRSEYPTIAEITKERLRRAGTKIRAEWEAKQKAAAEQADLLNPAPAVGERRAPDVGFRVFKLASSNIREWDPQRDRLAESLEAAVDHLKTDRTEQDILYELLLKLGLDLCVPIETRPFAGHGVSSVGAGSLLVCLSPKIAAAEVETLALGIVAWHKELKPAGETTVVFRDSAFADDIAKTNLAAILQQHGLETVRSL